MEDEEIKECKKELERIIGDRHRSELLEFEELKESSILMKYNKKYDKIMVHFSKLWGQIKAISRHAGGVAITNKKIHNYMALMKSKGVMQTCYDMDNLDAIKILKLDILGVAHYDLTHDVEKVTGEKFTFEKINDKKIYTLLQEGKTAGIFQLETPGATSKTIKIKPDCLYDIIAINSVNRPGANVQDYIEGKANGFDMNKPWSVYTKESYGAIIYQETVMMILKHVANMEWDDVDRAIKILGKDTEEARDLKDKFLKGTEGKIEKYEALELYNKMTQYLFNKGHASAYAILGAWETYLKYHYPVEFYWSACKNISGDAKKKENKLNYYMHSAICEGIYFLNPHANATAEFSIREIQGTKFIQIGTNFLKGIGDGTAKLIEENKEYASVRDLESRKLKGVTKTTLEVLERNNCFEFDMEEHIRRSVEFNMLLKRRDVKLKFN